MKEFKFRITVVFADAMRQYYCNNWAILGGRFLKIINPSIISEIPDPNTTNIIKLEFEELDSIAYPTECCSIEFTDDIPNGASDDSDNNNTRY